MRNLLLTFMTISLLLSSSTFAAEPRPDTEEVQNRRINQARDRLKEVEALRARAAEQLVDMRQQVRAQTGLVEVTPDSIRQVIGKLQEQREQLELDGAGAEGRRKGIDLA